MGRAIADALTARSDEVVAVVGRSTGSPEADAWAPLDVAFEFSHASSLLDHIELALGAGCRRIVIGTTGWTDDDEIGRALATRLDEHGASAIVAPTYSVGAVLFAQLAEEAARLFGAFPEYDPWILEQHRRTKADRPSGTALALADRLLPHLRGKREARLADGPAAPEPDVLEVVALRAGSHPGMHTLGFDGPGEALEISLTARDRSAYVAGALLAADTLLDHPLRPGITTFADLLRERAA